MKSLFLSLLLPLSLLGADVTQVFSSKDAPRVSLTTGYVDYWQVKAAPCRMVSLFGYNSGAQQFVQIFDTAQSNAAVAITSWSATPTYTAGAHSLSLGQPIQFTNTVNGITAGIYYARPITTDTLQVFDTYAHAVNGTATTGRQGSGGVTGTGTALLLPTHSFAAAGTDNFSCLVAGSGIQVGKGLLIATSSTGGTYTPSGTTNLTVCATIGSP
jgi:hypothetical protein